jgi:hypothetical protein
VEIAELAKKLNEISKGYSIGNLQTLREKIRGKPSRTHKIFTYSTIFDDYAFHDGGRHELQFNIGFESIEKKICFRFGVAFSLEPSRAHTDVSELFPKIKRFNYYIRTENESFPGFKMWYWSRGVRSADFNPRPFELDEAQIDNFLFLGKWVPVEEINLDVVLDTFDQLLPLYGFVEQGDYVAQPGANDVTFRPGCSSKKFTTSAFHSESELDVALRHNELQAALYGALSKEYGSNNVRTEHPTAVGGKVDAAVRTKDEMIFYEIKVAPSARGALRESIGQILEYAYWPNVTRAAELVIVGEPPATAEVIEYLKHLRQILGVKIFYRQLQMPSGRLSPPV